MRKNNRQEILDTARKLFLQYGYNGISMRTIASKAKLTTGAVYFHFKNKREIYETICHEALNILNRLFKEGIDSRETSPKKLISTFDSYLTFYNEYRDYYNILMEYKGEFLDTEDPDPGKNEITRRTGELLDMMAEVFTEGVNEGTFRNLDPHTVAFFLSSVTEGMLQFKKFGVHNTIGRDDNDFREFMKVIIGKGIQKQS
ncbi:MAG TPA: TetR/AcrR family transcriptional regulator [Spirochaetota bacterium]|nr:TetR/AcrR family transcriptional regulator [Spirochaetota bacterium]